MRLRWMRWRRRSSGATRPTAANRTSSEQLHALGTDRSQLASDLDTAAARIRALETTNREIARRLDVAIESVRNVLEANDR